MRRLKGAPGDCPGGEFSDAITAEAREIVAAVGPGATAIAVRADPPSSPPGVAGCTSSACGLLMQHFLPFIAVDEWQSRMSPQQARCTGTFCIHANAGMAVQRATMAIKKTAPAFSNRIACISI